MHIFAGLGLALASLHLQAAEPLPIVSRMADDDLTSLGVTVELIARPAAEDAPAFAARVVEAEGLVSWDGKPMMEIAGGNGLSLAGVFAGDGRNATVIYPSDRPDTLLVCRVRAPTTAIDPVRRRIAQWCAAGLGVELPDQPASPLIVGS